MEPEHILPFVARPGPILTVRDVHDLDGVPVEVIGERWRLKDLDGCPYAEYVQPDPWRPGEGVIHRLRSLETGTVTLPLNPAQIGAWERGEHRRGPRSRV